MDDSNLTQLLSITKQCLNAPEEIRQSTLRQITSFCNTTLVFETYYRKIQPNTHFSESDLSRLRKKYITGILFPLLKKGYKFDPLDFVNRLNIIDEGWMREPPATSPDGWDSFTLALECLKSQDATIRDWIIQRLYSEFRWVFHHEMKADLFQDYLLRLLHSIRSHAAAYLLTKGNESKDISIDGFIHWLKRPITLHLYYSSSKPPVKYRRIGSISIGTSSSDESANDGSLEIAEEKISDATQHSICDEMEWREWFQSRIEKINRLKKRNQRAFGRLFFFEWILNFPYKFFSPLDDLNTCICQLDFTEDELAMILREEENALSVRDLLHEMTAKPSEISTVWWITKTGCSQDMVYQWRNRYFYQPCGIQRQNLE